MFSFPSVTFFSPENPKSQILFWEPPYGEQTSKSWYPPDSNPSRDSRISQITRSLCHLSVMYYLSTSIQWAFLPLFCFKEPKFPFQKNYVILYDSKRGGGCFSFWKELVCFEVCLRTHSVYCKVRQEHFPLAPTSGLCSLLSCVWGGPPEGPHPHLALAALDEN